MSMHADEKSDEGISTDEAAEQRGLALCGGRGGRTSPEGNGGKTTAARTLRRDTASNGLVAVRRAARQSKNVKPPTFARTCGSTAGGERKRALRHDRSK